MFLYRICLLTVTGVLVDGLVGIFWMVVCDVCMTFCAVFANCG